MDDIPPPQTEWIAEQKLWMVAPDGGKCTAVTLAIGRPQGDDKPDAGPATCWALFEGMRDAVNVHGFNRWQALSLAFIFMHKTVKQYRDAAYRFFDRDDDDDETTVGQQLDNWSDEFALDVGKLFSQF